MELTLHSLTKNYSSFKALGKLDLTFGSGEITGILGANGAGKTTLLKILSGYFYPSQGYLNLGGTEEKLDPFYLRKRAAYLPEGAPLPKNRTPAQLHEEFFSLYKGYTPDKEELSRASSLFQWADEAHKKIRSLSKGYRQRIALSLTFMKQADIILLDEPFSGLDPAYLKSLRTLLKDQNSGKIILLSSHNLQEVFSLCQRIIILFKGEVRGDYSRDQFSTWEELDLEYNRLSGENDA